jgi:hypothetical protein
MRTECLDCNKSLEDCTCIEDTIELPNQALIEAAERYIAGDNYNRYYDDFIEGAKWSQERMYSEEEVIAFGEFIFKHTLLTHTRGVKSLFEQFKKK